MAATLKFLCHSKHSLSAERSCSGTKVSLLFPHSNDASDGVQPTFPFSSAVRGLLGKVLLMEDSKEVASGSEALLDCPCSITHNLHPTPLGSWHDSHLPGHVTPPLGCHGKDGDRLAHER